MTTHELPQANEDQTTTTAATTSRRELLGAAAVAACALCFAGARDALAATTAPAAGGVVVDAGPVATFKADGVYDALVKSHKVLIVREGKTLRASSALCTHRNALLQKSAKADAPIHCAKHNSDFDASGIPISGPAKTSLPRFAIKVENGRVMVDTGKSFDEKNWNDPAASATV